MERARFRSWLARAIATLQEIKTDVQPHVSVDPGVEGAIDAPQYARALSDLHVPQVNLDTSQEPVVTFRYNSVITEINADHLAINRRGLIGLGYETRIESACKQNELTPRLCPSCKYCSDTPYLNCAVNPSYKTGECADYELTPVLTFEQAQAGSDADKCKYLDELVAEKIKSQRGWRSPSVHLCEDRFVVSIIAQEECGQTKVKRLLKFHLYIEYEIDQIIQDLATKAIEARSHLLKKPIAPTYNRNSPKWAIRSSYDSGGFHEGFSSFSRFSNGIHQADSLWVDSSKNVMNDETGRILQVLFPRLQNIVFAESLEGFPENAIAVVFDSRFNALEYPMSALIIVTP